MFAAIWLPRFHLQAVLRALPQHREIAMAILDKTDSASVSSVSEDAKLICVSGLAESEGVFPGMSASQGQARCAGLRLLYRDARAECLANEDLQACALGWTPFFESAAPDLCILDLSRAPRVAGHEEECGRRMHAHLHDQRLDARIGFAANAGLATLSAHAADPVLVIRHHAREEQNVLRRLPVQALKPSPELGEVLRLWGIKTLGDFARLRRQDIAERLGGEGVMLWDLAAGHGERLLKLIRPPVSHREEYEFEHPVECLEPLLFVLRRMLDQLSLSLANDWLVAASLSLALRFEDASEHHRELRIAEPTRDAEVLFRVLHSHLEGVKAGAPVVLVSLEARPVRAANNQSLLFERSLRDPNRFAETLSQLDAMLGPGAAGRVILIPRHRPDSFRIAGFLEETRGARASPPGIHRDGLPLRRFRPPLPAQVFCCDGRPVVLQRDGSRHLDRCMGPWFLSGDWWDNGQRWHQEVWEAADEEGTIYRLIRRDGEWLIDGVHG